MSMKNKDGFKSFCPEEHLAGVKSGLVWGF
jgi:hypothetical protein